MSIQYVAYCQALGKFKLLELKIREKKGKCIKHVIFMHYSRDKELGMVRR